MAGQAGTDGGKRGRGFRRAARLVDARIKQAGQSRGFAVSRLLTQWDEIVGPELAALARPVRVHYGRGSIGATLTLLVSGAAAPLVQMRLPRIVEKVNACYGYAAIGQVRVTQTAAEGFADPVARSAHAKPAASPPPDPAAEGRARDAAAGVSDPALRAALERLGRHVLSPIPGKEADA